MVLAVLQSEPTDSQRVPALDTLCDLASECDANRIRLGELGACAGALFDLAN